MANIASARKRARQAVAHRLRNTSQKSLLRSQIKKVVNAIENGDKETAGSAYQEALPIIDRMANKGLIHKNKAARHKSRLHARIQAISAK